MIEKKFKSLLESFLRGDISAAETVWMVEDLRQKRERRDLFIEEIEDYLERFSSGPAESSDEHLRQLLLKDLSRVDVSDIERATPRQRRAIPAKEIEERSQRRDAGWEDDEGLEKGRKRALPVEHHHGEKHAAPGEDRSYVLPVLGILMIVGTFVLLVRLSSPGNREADQGDPISAAISEGLSDSEAVRRANEFLAERRPAVEIDADGAEEDDGESGEPVDSVLVPPVSLVDLVGFPNGEADSFPSEPVDVDDLLPNRMPGEEETVASDEDRLIIAP